MTAAVSAEQIVEHYDALFPSLTRAAHRACLEYARHVRDDGWPTVVDCLAFAKLYGVEASGFSAFFGHLGWSEGGRPTWVDTLRGPVHSGVARSRATDSQALSLGFLDAFVETVDAGTPRDGR